MGRNYTPRVDSTSETVRAMAAATKEIDPPKTVPLTDDELPLFHSVIAEFSKSELSQHKIEMVAILARIMFSLVEEQRKEKPRQVLKIMETIISVRRSLSLHGRAMGPRERPNKVAKRREHLKDVERESPLKEELIARPSPN